MCLIFDPDVTTSQKFGESRLLHQHRDSKSVIYLHSGPEHCCEPYYTLL